MYVLGVKATTGEVVVGPRRSLERTTLTASGVNWILEEPRDAIRVSAQIRHRHQAAAARVRSLGSDRAEVIYDTPQIAITPGQAVVFYDGDVVVGGGWID
jgi:tRNA-specific 2-thiouridylase